MVATLDLFEAHTGWKYCCPTVPCPLRGLRHHRLRHGWTASPPSPVEGTQNTIPYTPAQYTLIVHTGHISRAPILHSFRYILTTLGTPALSVAETQSPISYMPTQYTLIVHTGHTSRAPIHHSFRYILTTLGTPALPEAEIQSPTPYMPAQCPHTLHTGRTGCAPFLHRIWRSCHSPTNPLSSNTSNNS